MEMQRPPQEASDLACWRYGRHGENRGGDYGASSCIGHACIVGLSFYMHLTALSGTKFQGLGEGVLRRYAVYAIFDRIASDITNYVTPVARRYSLH